jgi:four helix bundle protein
VGDYRKLEVWKLACDISDRVDALYLELPARVQRGLGEQLVRAADSVHLNISEGCGLNTDAQFAKHVRQALGSANELEDGLLRLERRGLLPEHRRDLLDDVPVLRRKLGALLKRLR